MTCQVCVYLSQYILNWLNLADHALNTVLLGDADETVSARVARARNGGRSWAGHVCKMLSGTIRIITFGKIDRDHCVYALDKTIRPNSREIWNWTTMSLNPVPVSEVQVIDNGSSDSQG